MANIDIVQTHWKPETKKTGDSSNAVQVTKTFNR